jgi:hypothetical protein
VFASDETIGHKLNSFCTLPHPISDIPNGIKWRYSLYSCPDNFVDGNRSPSVFRRNRNHDADKPNTSTNIVPAQAGTHSTPAPLFIGI